MKADLTIRERLQGQDFYERIEALLPPHMNAKRMIAVTLAALVRQPALCGKDVDQTSFFQAITTLSELGLEPNGRNAHLIPFKNNRTGKTEIQLIVDYKGLVSILHRSGKVSRIHCDVIYQNDRFEYDRGSVRSHTPWWLRQQSNSGEVVGAFCIIEMKDGSEKCEIMPKSEIDGIRSRSRAGKSGPWVTDYNEMAKKTVFRRASKWLSLSPEAENALHADYDTRPPLARDAPNVIDAETFKAMLTDARETASDESSLVSVQEESDISVGQA